MAKWQRTLDLSPEWNRAKAGEIPAHELAAVIAKRLKSLRPFPDGWVEEQRLDLVADFSDLAADIELLADEFDVFMDALYDWADTSLDTFWNGRKVCWIERTGRLPDRSDEELT